MKNCIYRFISKENEIIYIGKAKDLHKRLKNHNHLDDECYKELAFIEYTSFDSEHEMEFAERYFIQKLTPKYNKLLSDKPISFNCEDLDKKVFNIYEINQYVVERTMEQIELLKKENMFIELNTSIIELAGMFMINKCDNFISKSVEQHKVEFKSYDKFKKWNDTFLNKIILQLNNFKNKYHLLNIKIAYRDIENIGKYLDLEKDEFLMVLKYKEKYKEEFKELDFIIRCI